MQVLRIFCLVFIAVCVLPRMGIAFNSKDAASVAELPLKAAAESVMTNQNNVSASSDVAMIWRYVDYLWENDRSLDAKKYIESGLSFAPFNYFYQARLAQILAKQGNHAAAVDRARIVYEKSEDSAPALMVAELLGKTQVQAFPPLEKVDFASPTVVLVTIGSVEPIVVDELKQRISEYMGLEVVVFKESATPPEADRSHYTTEIEKMRGNILALPEVKEYLQKQKIDVEKLKAYNDFFVDTMIQFLAKSSPAAAEDFSAKMAFARLMGRQWKYDSLRDYLINMVKPFKGKNWLLVGVTGFDLFMENTNFVFAGTNPYSQAIISYQRFTGVFNQEPQNRQRLVTRLFKQFLSVFGLLNGMVRCTFPECARVFPRSLPEHDEKPAYFCNECRRTLEELLKISIKSNYP